MKREQIIDNYAHDFRDMPMTEDALKAMLLVFLEEYGVEEEEIQGTVDYFYGIALKKEEGKE